ncbi:MAG: hypothetical protein AAF206_09930, partial [Bacteroidota bacterium]
MSKFSIAMLVSAVFSLFVAEPEKQDTPETDMPQAHGLGLVDSVLDIPQYFPPGDTNKPNNPNNRPGDPTTQGYVTPLTLGMPKNVEISYEISEDGKGYYIYEKVGGINVRPPSYISRDDYIELRRKKGIDNYFREQSLSSSAENRDGLALNLDLEELSDIFGGGPVSIRPTGYATLDFSLDRNKTDNPSLPQRQQRTTAFNFDQQIQ